MPTFPPPANILITGASSGIGAALALGYAKPGVTLGLTGRDGKRLRDIARACEEKGAHVLLEVTDVTDRAAMADLVARFDAEAPLDLVIANAGVSSGTHTPGLAQRGEDEDQARGIFAVNLDGVLNTIWPVIRVMTPRRHGQIAIVSSLAGYHGLPGAPAYSASKAAVKAYGEALRPRLEPMGIRVSVICPGFVESRITAENRFTMPFLMSSARAAGIIRRGLADNRGLIAFPWPMRLISWGFAVLPAVMSEWLVRRLPRKT